MKNLCYTLIVFSLSAVSLFAQKAPGAEKEVPDSKNHLETVAAFSNDENSAQDQSPQYRWNIRLYPISLLTNFRSEVGYSSTQGLQINVLTGIYYNKFMLWNASYDSYVGFKTPFLDVATGLEINLSLEQKLTKKNVWLGFSMGYFQYEVTPTVYEEPQVRREVARDQKQYSLLMILRLRQSLKDNFYIEETLQFGADQVNRHDILTAYSYNVAYMESDESGIFWRPNIRLSVNIGFGF